MIHSLCRLDSKEVLFTGIKYILIFQVNHTETPKPIQSTLHNEVDEEALRQKVIKKQKELLELQQKKLELELIQTRNQIELQKKKMNKVNLFKVNIFNNNSKLDN